MAVTVTFNNVVVENNFQTNTFELTNQLLPDVLGLSNGGFACAYNNSNATDGVITVNFYDAERNVVGTIHRDKASDAENAMALPTMNTPSRLRRSDSAPPTRFPAVVTARHARTPMPPSTRRRSPPRAWS